MGHNDFRTDDEIAALEAADRYRPKLEQLEREISKRDRKIAKKDKEIANLKEQLVKMRLRLDDALDAAQGS